MADNTMLRRPYDATFRMLMQAVERDLMPDFIIRSGIRYLLSHRVAEVGSNLMTL
jgi:tRNA(His) 5'-end guanylyltransferase